MKLKIQKQNWKKLVSIKYCDKKDMIFVMFSYQIWKKKFLLKEKIWFVYQFILSFLFKVLWLKGWKRKLLKKVFWNYY